MTPPARVVVQYDPSDDETLPVFAEEEEPTAPIEIPITIDWEDFGDDQ